GDAVYELYVRSHTLSLKKGGIHEHHIESVKFAKAKSQAKMLISIMPSLSSEEQDIVRRGRNTKTTHIPKNAGVLEYRRATAFEALIGYLYLSRKYSRVSEIMKMVFEIDEQEHQKI
ncbi:MAG TPA: Mini-ribonuclease 3, partial [Clostridiaceae bacterium]|nr:Mini-ribonuclease 3 [Clostridiaceae bacterium]